MVTFKYPVALVFSWKIIESVFLFFFSEGRPPEDDPFQAVLHSRILIACAEFTWLPTCGKPLRSYSELYADHSSLLHLELRHQAKNIAIAQKQCEKNTTKLEKK